MKNTKSPMAELGWSSCRLPYAKDDGLAVVSSFIHPSHGSCDSRLRTTILISYSNLATAAHRAHDERDYSRSRLFQASIEFYRMTIHQRKPPSSWCLWWIEFEFYSFPGRLGRPWMTFSAFLGILYDINGLQNPIPNRFRATMVIDK